MPEDKEQTGNHLSSTIAVKISGLSISTPSQYPLFALHAMPEDHHLVLLGV